MNMRCRSWKNKRVKSHNTSASLSVTASTTATDGLLESGKGRGAAEVHSLYQQLINKPTVSKCHGDLRSIERIDDFLKLMTKAHKCKTPT